MIYIAILGYRTTFKFDPFGGLGKDNFDLIDSRSQVRIFDYIESGLFCTLCLFVKRDRIATGVWCLMQSLRHVRMSVRGVS